MRGGIRGRVVSCRGGEPIRGILGSRMPDELLSSEQFDALLEARVVIAAWKHEYNPGRALAG